MIRFTQPFWTPLDLGASLIAWWDAERSDLITRDGGGLVSSWRDVVGGYNAAIATTALKPVYSATGFGGRPVITGDGVDDYLQLVPVPAAVPVGAAGSEVWAALDQVALPADATIRIATGYGGSSTTNRYLARTTSGGINRAIGTFGDGASQKASRNDGVVLTGRHFVRAAFSSAAVQTDADGIAGTSTVGVPATAATTLRIFGGSAASNANLFQGGLNSVLITASLTALQASRMQAYFGGRMQK